MKFLKIFILSAALLLADLAFDGVFLHAKNKKKSSISSNNKSKNLKNKHRYSKSRETSSYLVQMSLSLLKEYCPEYSRKTNLQSMNFVERKAHYTNHINEVVYPYTLDGSSYFSFDNIYYESLAADSSEGLRESVFDGITTRIRAINEINSWLGTPYKYAGRSRKGIDCSNFTSVILSEFIGSRFPAGADSQSKLFNPIKNIEDLQFGDIMFFSSSARSNGRIGHSGIYIGNGLFAHSSSYKKRGVVYQHITDSKYTERFQFGGRLLKSRWLPAI